MVTIAPLNFDDFRQTARALVESGVAPDQVFWSSSQDLLPLIPDSEPPPASAAKHFRVPRAFVALAEVAACHRSDRRWDVLYRLLWRIVHEGSQLIEQEIDPEISMCVASTGSRSSACSA